VPADRAEAGDVGAPVDLAAAGTDDAARAEQLVGGRGPALELAGGGEGDVGRRGRGGGDHDVRRDGSTGPALLQLPPSSSVRVAANASRKRRSWLTSTTVPS
jgi:hypothetical protein